jgi:hypothetical protein
MAMRPADVDVVNHSGLFAATISNRAATGCSESVMVAENEVALLISMP